MTVRRYVQIDGVLYERGKEPRKGGAQRRRLSKAEMLVVAGIVSILAVVLWQDVGDYAVRSVRVMFRELVKPPPAGLRPLTPVWPRATSDPVQVSGDRFAKNYYVVLDASGSMNGTGCSGNLTKFNAARSALLEFARSIAPEANLGLQIFDAGSVRERLALGVGNRERFNEALRGAVANGTTPLQSSIRQAYARLREQGARQLGYGEYHLVMVTDGEADRGEDPSDVVNALLAESPVVLHTIGFCIGENHSLNQPGRTLYRAADNPAQLRAGLAEVLAEAPAFQVVQFGK
jgi:hypothetical protein